MTTSTFLEDFSAHETGIVMTFNGSLSNIPKGWVIADGNNGTPDLRNKYIKGNTDYTSTKNVGGIKEKQLSYSQLPSHNHTASVNTGGSHTHSVGGQAISSDGSGYRYITSGSVDSTQPTTNDGGHSHVGGNSSNNSGSNEAIDNRPKSQEVIFIYKI